MIMFTFIFGILIGLLAFYVLRDIKAGLREWALFIIGLIFVILGFEILINSYAEHEIRAAWFGFLLSNIIAAVLIYIAYRNGLTISLKKFLKFKNE